LNTKIFKALEYNEKKNYLLDIFNSLKEVYPIYKKIYDLLSGKEYLDNKILDKIYESIEKIGKENEKTQRIETKKNEKRIRKSEEKEKKKELSEIEEYFL
jgi:hypothetical protein